MAKPDLKTFRDRMDKSVAALKDDYAGLRTGRAEQVGQEQVQVRKCGFELALGNRRAGETCD